jgi:uncharacterized protein
MAHPIRSVLKSHLWFYVYRDQSAKHEYRWTLYGANKLKIANSGEGYTNKADCVHALNLVATRTGSGINVQFAPGITPIDIASA